MTLVLGRTTIWLVGNVSLASIEHHAELEERINTARLIEDAPLIRTTCVTYAMVDGEVDTDSPLIETPTSFDAKLVAAIYDMSGHPGAVG